ncbi:hypothetical protein E5161_11435 [Cohnella pontilimi]|uniref:Uncharacterized protein n=1 Tax=Cohnella pontilimi TaxID=2564100 RepID=A0A4V5LS53_9BACL|nr:hypothetical protein [Cohnella pontilimi]TJY41809.1 hypothetical protein E5161_11435 [Cohnella pontilimi]
MKLGTRLLSEYLIKNCYPEIRYVRIHTTAKNTAVIYAWNEDLKLTDPEITRLKRFAAGYLSPYVCFTVKEYRMIRTDQVPPVYDLPEHIMEAAMSRNLDQHRILAVINRMLSNGELTFMKYDWQTGIIHFDLTVKHKVTDIEKDLIRQYLYELIPLGSRFALDY